MQNSIQKSAHHCKMVLGLFGAGGFAREVMPIARQFVSGLRSSDSEGQIELFFVDTDPNLKELNGCAVISEKEFFDLDSPDKRFNIAVGDSRIREQIAKKCIENGIRPQSLQSENVVLYDCNQIGDGAIICAFSTITSNAKIGDFFHSNIYSYVAHDCVIGDYVTFAPNVHCNGNVHIHSHAYIGTGAIIKQGAPGKPLTIGQGAIVGMGAVVTKDVAPYTTVVGNPARIFEKR